MADLSSSTNEQNAVTARTLKRLRILTIASLAFNGLILLLIVLGVIVHHHRMERGFGDRGPGFHSQDRGFGGGWRRFHRFDGCNWERRGGFEQGGRFGRFGGGRGGQGFQGGFGMKPGGPPPGMPGMNPGKPDPAKMSEMVMNRLSQKLTLTEDEKAKIKPIIDQQVADFQKQMEAQRAAMQKQMEDARAKIRALLTTDQQKQLDAMPLPGQKPSGTGTTPPNPGP